MILRDQIAAFGILVRMEQLLSNQPHYCRVTPINTAWRQPKVGNAGEESVLRRLEWHLGEPPIFMGFYLRAVLLQVLLSGAGKIKVESLQS